MNSFISPSTQAALLLTAPLLAGRDAAASSPLTPAEYRRLTTFLREMHRDPTDLLAPGAHDLFVECEPVVDTERLERLLARGFLLSHAIERWQARAIWVVSPPDADYPQRLKARLGEHAPPLLFGCGDTTLLNSGGLAVVGSRHASDFLIHYAEAIGRSAAAAGCTLVSGGARGVDAAAMRGAIEAGGNSVGVLADGLERAALNHDNRQVLLQEQLVLTSPYDPAASFSVGNAMQRNKLIYALAESALVVSSDLEKGGTWAGAVEQLEKLHLIPIYVRATGDIGEGLEALQQKGALPWPDPQTTGAFAEAVAAVDYGRPSNLAPDPQFSKLRKLAEEMTAPSTEADVAEHLQISRKKAHEWLKLLVAEGVLEKLSRPVRYKTRSTQGSLFGESD